MVGHSQMGREGEGKGERRESFPISARQAISLRRTHKQARLKLKEGCDVVNAAEASNLQGKVDEEEGQYRYVKKAKG